MRCAVVNFSVSTLFEVLSSGFASPSFTSRSLRAAEIASLISPSSAVVSILVGFLRSILWALQAFVILYLFFDDLSSSREKCGRNAAVEGTSKFFQLELSINPKLLAQTDDTTA